MKEFVTSFIDYVCSGHAMLAIMTHEKDRAIEEMVHAAQKSRRQAHIWSIASGWRNTKGEESVGNSGLPEPDQAIQQILKLPEKCLCILKDFGPYLRFETNPRADVVIGWLEEIKQTLANTQRTIIFVGPDFQAPLALRHDITQIDFDLPDEKQIEKCVRFVADGVQTEDGKPFKITEATLPDVVNACKGMTQQQTLDRVALAIRRHKLLNGDAVKTILHEKAGVIRSSGILTYHEPPSGGLNMVGGLVALKDHLGLDKPCFGEEAREFGIEFPKGLLLVGIPGCGKTLISIAIASEFGFPLVSMDVGSIMDKYVGESESNMREAIRILESIAPCVLQLDEIEKGFGGVGDLDGGASKRVFGTFIKWLNDKSSPVYVVATANEVQSLPPEFARKGRFDEIFGVDLPSVEERTEIVRIHLAKRKRDPREFNIGEIVDATENYTGADIEQAVKVGLKMAFASGVQLTTAHCIQGAKTIAPLFKTEPGRIQNIRDWCATRAKSANLKPQVAATEAGKPVRKVTVGK